MKRILFFSIVLFAVSGISARQAQYVWDTPTGEGRQQYVYFRNEVDLSELPSKAELNLYAYSRYALIINGEYINFGPSRSVKKYPYYDTYNILPSLKTGTNIIVVEAMNNGINTFQIPYGTAAFIAWGEIAGGNGEKIDLSTPGNWFCRAAKGYAPNVQRFSFATGPLECFDSRLEPDDWRGVDIVAKEWKKPAVLKDQTAFGELAPRSIPPLTQKVVRAKKCLFLSNKEFFGTLYNFQVLGEGLYHGDDNGKRSVQAYTYIYSPDPQMVSARLSWGEYWLNGKKLEKKESNIPFQHYSELPLNAGWNLLFGDMEIVFGGTEFMMVLPDNANLVVSADKGKDVQKGFAISGPNAQKAVPDSLVAEFNSDKKNKKTNWFFAPAQSPTVNPAKTVSWMMERRMMAIDPTTQGNVSLSSERFNNILFDLGGKQLGRIFVNVDAPVGAVIDVTFSENLKDDNMELFRLYTVNSGVRFISKGGKQRFESFKPYGLRYMQVTVTNDSRAVTLEDAGVISQIYPFEKEGSFTCSDPLLNSIWELGWRTLRVCSEDTYIDTPFRERGHYAGDMYPEYAITLATSGDSRLVKHTIRMFLHANEKNYLGNEGSLGNDFTAINLMVAAWYIRMTDDADFVKEVYPYFKNYLHRWYENRTMPQGYYHPKGDTFFEWVQIDRSAALTQFQTLIYALNKEMVYLAGRMGDHEEADFAGRRAKEAKEMINEHFWGTEANGVYFDGIGKNGRWLMTKFPNSSLFPVIYGVTDEEKDKMIFETLYFDLLKNIGPSKDETQLISSYGGFYSLAAMYAKEKAGLAEAFIRKHWSPMIYWGDDTAWEDFVAGFGTLSHAWSCSPTYYLSTQTLGVQLGYPDLFDPNTITIAPQSETLDWAKGKVPHPKGLVSVSWRVAGNNLYLDYTAPEGVPVKVEPRGRLANYNLILNQTVK